MIDIDGMAERYYSSADPQYRYDNAEEIHDRASLYVARACISAIDDLSEEERRSLADDTDELWAMIIEYLC